MFTFETTSRDARIREGDFTLALSNEGSPAGDPSAPLDLHTRWHVQLDLDPQAAEEAVAEAGLKDWLAHAPLRKLLEVEVARLEAAAEPPYVVLAIKNPDFFDFAEEQGLINVAEPMVLDPLHEDFATEQVERVLRAVGHRRDS